MDAGLVKAAKSAIQVLLKIRGVDLVLIPEKGDVVTLPDDSKIYAAGTPLPPQRFALRSSAGDDAGVTESEDGRTVQNFDYILTGTVDCVVPLPCYWIHNANRYRVERELTTKEYCRKFTVRSSGPEPAYG